MIPHDYALIFYQEKKKMSSLRNLEELLWETFSKGVRILYNQNIPDPEIINALENRI